VVLRYIRKYFGGVKRGRHARLTVPPPSVSRLSRKCRILDMPQPYKPPMYFMRPFPFTVWQIPVFIGSSFTILWGLFPLQFNWYVDRFVCLYRTYKSLLFRSAGVYGLCRVILNCLFSQHRPICIVLRIRTWIVGVWWLIFFTHNRKIRFWISAKNQTFWRWVSKVPPESMAWIFKTRHFLPNVIYCCL
jgi:hypothetical protein